MALIYVILDFILFVPLASAIAHKLLKSNGAISSNIAMVMIISMGVAASALGISVVKLFLTGTLFVGKYILEALDKIFLLFGSSFANQMNSFNVLHVVSVVIIVMLVVVIQVSRIRITR